MKGKLKEVKQAHTDTGTRYFVTLEVSANDVVDFNLAARGAEFRIESAHSEPSSHRDLGNVSSQRLLNELARRVR